MRQLNQFLTNFFSFYRRLIAETMARALEAQQTRELSQSSCLDELNAELARYRQSLLDRQKWIQEEVERIKESAQVRSAQEEMLVRLFAIRTHTSQSYC